MRLWKSANKMMHPDQLTVTNEMHGWLSRLSRV